MGNFSVKEINDFFDVIGLDEVDRNIEDIDLDDVDNLSELYAKSIASRVLPTSSDEVGVSYELFKAILEDDFWFETKEEKGRARKDAFAIINKLTCFQVSETNDPYEIFERTNQLLLTIFTGLSECPDMDLAKFKIYLDNASVPALLEKLADRDIECDLRLVYGLAALSKFDAEDDYKMFNKFDQVDPRNLYGLIVHHYEEDRQNDVIDSFGDKIVSINNPVLTIVEPINKKGNSTKEEITTPELKLVKNFSKRKNFRPSYRSLQNIED